jgi:membrane-associated protease RseP (regulator of RpoE activity)
MSRRGIALVVALMAGMLAVACVAAVEKADDGYLGLFLEPVPQILAVHLGLADGAGIVAADVAAESPADKAGLSQYDVVVSLNGKDVKGQEAFAAAIRAAGAGSKVKLGLISKGQKKDVEVTLGALSDATGKGKNLPPKGGRRLMREGEQPNNLQGPGARPGLRMVPRFEPMPGGGPEEGIPYVAPGGDDQRIQALEDRMAEIERQQGEILDKLDKLLAK